MLLTGFKLPSALQTQADIFWDEPAR